MRRELAAIALSLLHHPDHTASHNAVFQVVPLSPADHTGDIVDNRFPRLLYYSIEMKLEGYIVLREIYSKHIVRHYLQGYSISSNMASPYEQPFFA